MKKDMKFAVQYSTATADLVQTGQIRIDCFKSPAWTDLISIARDILPTYVHFPLRVGLGIENAFDEETKQPVDWEKVEKLRVIAFEYGGVGRLWELVTDKETLRQQIPRLGNLVKDEQPG